MQYGVERLKLAKKMTHMTYMTYRTQSLYFAGRAWPHGLRTPCDRIGHAHMTHIDARTGA
jgi:hypothetical protein